LKITELLKGFNKDSIKEFKTKTEEKLIEKTNNEIELIEQIRNFQNYTYKSKILNDLNVNL